jgi:hypothetical protein
MSLKYKKFSQLMASVESDISTFADEGYVNRGTYIKEARKVNEDLGLKINGEKEVVLDVKDYKIELPEDFIQLNLALACHISYVRTPILRGDQTESHTIEGNVNVPFKTFNDDTCLRGEGKKMWVTQKVGTKLHTFTHIEKLQLSQKSLSKCADDCFNRHFKSHNVIDIQENEAAFSFREGKVYLNYVTDLIGDDGDLMILDHPLTNDYYEYAIKKKFFENMKFNKEGDFLQDYQIAKQELKEARTRALTFVNMPEYDEVVKVHLENRKRFYKTYIDYFDELKTGYYNI